ncbi:MAG: hypothetical protein JJ920_16425 [Roseitalea sp.]|jgi:hypothetical protein|nr:hypothetical protein [Roseitalea sp.]MBO6722725.1 hypothetical protein [Roseitalea sp.]MBO6744500.1 hypothetical protein [Roseitalea sp.]
MTALALTRRRHARAIAARLVLIATLVMAAFAHRPAAPTPSGMTALEMAQYVLPDGSLPVLCLPGQDGHISGGFCEFCLIAGSAAPPAPGPCQPVLHRVLATGTAGLARAGPPFVPVHLQTAPLRGPPATA